MFPFESPRSAIVRLLKPSQQRLQDRRVTKTIGLLCKIFTPRVPIYKPEEFSGREELLKTMRERLATSGQTLVIYGHRGLGKTSLVLVALHKRPILRHTCSSASTFQTIFRDILTQLDEQFSVVERSSKQGDSFELGVRELGKIGLKDESSEKKTVVAKQTLDPNFVAARLGPWQNELKAIVIDEFQEVRELEDQQAFIDTAKILSDHRVDIPIVLVGHAPSDMDLFKVPAYRENRGRYISAIEVKEMPDSELVDIIERRQRAYGTRFTPQALKAIVRIAAGYPTVVHRLALDASVERASQQTNPEVGWRSVFGGLGQTDTFLDEPTWLVNQFHLSSAVSKFVQDERDAQQDAFIDLIESFSKAVPRQGAEQLKPFNNAAWLTYIREDHMQRGPEEEREQPAGDCPIPLPVLRGAGYAAKFHLETPALATPSYLVYPNMDAGNEAAVLRRWANYFYRDDLNLAEEKEFLPRVVGGGGWSVAANRSYGGATPAVVGTIVIPSGEEPTAKETYLWPGITPGITFERPSKDQKADKKPEPPK